MNSITDTSAPKRRYTCPNSKPITPPPIITKCFGISFSFRASVEVIILSLSKVINGKDEGLEPVAIMVFFASISSKEALKLKEIPKHLVIIGGGVIGLELGQVYRRLGAEVSVIEFMDRIIPAMDKAQSKELTKTFKKQGVKFLLSHKVSGVVTNGDQVTVKAKDKKDKEVVITGDYCLVSVGRRPYTDGLKLENAGIKINERGQVEVNKYLQTNISNIYAIGDVIEGPMLAHKAEEEGIAVAELIAGQSGHVNYDVIPGVVYTSPEVAAVGKTEEQLQSLGTKYKVGKFQFIANSRAKAINETEGFVKILADEKTDKVLGVHIIGLHAGEMIAEMAVAMEFGASAEDIARTCHAHPTFSEAVKEAALSVDKRAIHS
jgi:dihydrolipoamide dehydrogenase